MYNKSNYPYCWEYDFMEEKKQRFVHDTINLEEIRDLLEDQPKKEGHAEMPEDQTHSQGTASVENEKPEEPKSALYEIYGMLHDLVYILAAVTLLFVFVVRLVGVDGTSMVPTLHNGDFLLLESNFLYRPDDIQNGDIVVINEPYHWNRDQSLIVKRVIATEGQTIDIDFEKGEVYVDGVLLQEDYINEPTYFCWDGDYATELPATVPEGHIFVLGDNRNNSSDSRFAPVGMIDERCVLGKAVAIALPGQTKSADGTVTSPRQWNRIGMVE